MRKILIIAFLAFFGNTYAQEGITVSGNSLSIREIPPVWPGCSGSEAEKKACFKKQLVNHVVTNFRFPEGYKKGSVKEPVIVDFVINEEGKPQILGVKGGTKALQEEAKRNILAIPQMTPGQAGGKPRAIKYSMPFTF
ncbi:MULTISPECIES: energy transducer TonB [unclassified Leeuwenhoekiella]|uniref:energy transducer TonB n=1 Tax=unclassified Leeuwenhoekiella TaxID=2615029 RepID=UPI000C3E5DBA|nr:MULTISPECIES: energy transducer TonB [unclassified Leeuwenhoekiella]MBA82553.1 energy transducer TonB [Leeuwenhoekiella sp.]|tara:strand:+ start:39687 stop:40100 length:414 start_codon:yes stop_codon:yes gene_type:complete